MSVLNRDAAVGSANSDWCVGLVACVMGLHSMWSSDSSVPPGLPLQPGLLPSGIPPGRYRGRAPGIEK